MTALEERSPAQQAPKTKGKAASAVPEVMQVNLLPPEVTAARTLQRVKLWLLAAVGLVLVALLAVFAMALLAERGAEDRLATAQDRTAQLQREAAQYAEVPRVLGEIADVEEAREIGMSTEIRWQPYVDAIAAVLPSTMSVASYTVNGPAPQDALPSPGDALQRPSVGSIAFDALSRTVPDTAQLMDDLEAVPGFQDVRVTSVGLVDGDDGSALYQVAGSVQLTDATFERRFVDAEVGVEEE